ncbi:MAG TPA: hypothetical protein VHR84_20160 [Terriglobales bacterium]|nr:hypothetical protein [Terriglobales bacterium]
MSDEPRNESNRARRLRVLDDFRKRCSFEGCIVSFEMPDGSWRSLSFPSWLQCCETLLGTADLTDDASLRAMFWLGLSAPELDGNAPSAVGLRSGYSAWAQQHFASTERGNARKRHSARRTKKQDSED